MLWNAGQVVETWICQALQIHVFRVKIGEKVKQKYLVIFVGQFSPVLHIKNYMLWALIRISTHMFIEK